MQIAVICKIKTNISEIRKAFAPPFSTEFSPLYMCCNIHHFGITKRKVIASKLQVTPRKLQVTPRKLQVTPTKLQVTSYKLEDRGALCYCTCGGPAVTQQPRPIKCWSIYFERNLSQVLLAARKGKLLKTMVKTTH